MSPAGLDSLSQGVLAGLQEMMVQGRLPTEGQEESGHSGSAAVKSLAAPRVRQAGHECRPGRNCDTARGNQCPKCPPMLPDLSISLENPLDVTLDVTPPGFQ